MVGVKQNKTGKTAITKRSYYTSENCYVIFKGALIRFNTLTKLKISRFMNFLRKLFPLTGLRDEFEPTVKITNHKTKQ